MVKKDLKKNKAIHVVLLFFIAISACLVSVGSIIIIQLFDSIESMYEIAKPPHFMQMHVGEIDADKIEDFANEFDYVTDWQIINMLNVSGSNIWVTKSDDSTYSFADCMLDMGMVKENEKYDLLLDSNNKPYYPNQGEIGVPVILLDNYDIDIGDKITVSDGSISKSFIVSEFLRDPQMNSTLCSSTRFLLNEQDIAELSGFGETEYLIEFYFTDTSYATEFQTAYENAGMPINGQGLTYTIIRLISGLSDMITVVLIILVSMTLTLVAGLCLRFTILAAIEEDIREIGNMKAIGFSFQDIRAIYMQKYRVLIIAGCVLGYIVSMVVYKIFTSHIANTFGESGISLMTYGIPVVFAILIYCIDVSLCKKILKNIKNVSVIETIRGQITSSGNKKDNKKKPLKLSSVKLLNVNVWVGLRDILIHRKTWYMLFFVIMISTSIMLIPLNLINTFKSPEFITYMGQPRCDIVVSVSMTSGLEDKMKEIQNILDQDNDISTYVNEAFIMNSVINKDGEWMNLHVAYQEEVSQLGLQFVEGGEPEDENEIALSLLNAEELGVKSSDNVTMNINGKKEIIKVSGIYQDVTNGGYTSKMFRDYVSDDAYKYSFAIDVKNGVDIKEKTEEYLKIMGSEADVKELDEFVSQTLGGVNAQLGKAVLIVDIMAIGLAILITVLFLKLIMIKECSQIAILKTIGFSTNDIRKQYLYKTCIVSAIGIIIGMIFVGIFGESIVSLFISMIGLGISKISFIINPLTVYVLCPGILLTVVIASTIGCSSVFKSYDIVKLIKE